MIIVFVLLLRSVYQVDFHVKVQVSTNLSREILSRIHRTPTSNCADNEASLCLPV